MFSQPRVEKVFSQFVTVQLHLPPAPSGMQQWPDAQAAREFRDEKFQNFALPYYVVLRPKGKTLYRVATYTKGVIDDPEEFAAMLEKAREVKVP